MCCQQELCFARVSLAEPVVCVRQDLVFVQVVTYMGAYDMFCYLADHGREGHRAVVGGVITCSCLEDGRDPCVLPGAREYTNVKGLVEEGSNGRAQVIRQFLQDSGWNLVMSCCFPRVQVLQELTDSRFWHFQGSDWGNTWLCGVQIRNTTDWSRTTLPSGWGIMISIDAQVEKFAQSSYNGGCFAMWADRVVHH